jgi:hypothetical protein
MKHYRHITASQKEVLYISLMLERAGCTYRRDFDARDAASFYADGRSCSHLIFGNKRTYDLLPHMQELWNLKVIEDAKKAKKNARNARRRELYALKKAAQ